jgi:hypothetical protein
MIVVYGFVGIYGYAQIFQVHLLEIVQIQNEIFFLRAVQVFILWVLNLYLRDSLCLE